MARILLIDDDEWVLKLLTQILELEGHIVLQATNGNQGLTIYQHEPTDLVITDMVMPFKDGLETIMDIKHEYPDAKIIAISGGGAIEPERYLSLAETIGAIRTLHKPLSKDGFIEAVNEVLAEKS